MSRPPLAAIALAALIAGAFWSPALAQSTAPPSSTPPSTTPPSTAPPATAPPATAPPSTAPPATTPPAATQQASDPDNPQHGGNGAPLAGNAAQADASCPPGGGVLPTYAFGGVGNTVKAISKAAQTYLRNCHCPDPRCIADVLDNYAAALEAIAPSLPPQAADLPAIVRKAARQVRAARTVAQAHAVLRQVAVVLQAKLKLLTVDDPDARSDAARSTLFVRDTFAVADVALKRVNGL